MGRRAKDIVCEQFRAAVSGVFEIHSDRNTTVQPIQAEHATKLFRELGEEREMLSSIIRLEGDVLNACLALMANAETIEAIAPNNSTHPRDYVGELANLVLGAFKNSLSEFGVLPRLGLPISVQGLRLELLLDLREVDAAVAILDSGPVVATLHYTVPDELWTRSTSPAAAEAGSICMF